VYVVPVLLCWCAGRTPAKEHRHNLHSHTHATAVPYIKHTSISNFKIRQKNSLKHVGVVGIILVSHIGAISWLYCNKVQLLHGKNMKIVGVPFREAPPQYVIDYNSIQLARPLAVDYKNPAQLMSVD